MPATARVELGAATPNRKWYLDVNTGTAAVPVWTGVFGVKEFKPTFSPDWKDTTDFDAAGWKSETSFAGSWGADVKVGRKVTAASATAYDPGQEALRLTASAFGTTNRVQIRYYEMADGGPRIEAYQGYVSVEWSEDGGDYAAASEASISLKGQGRRNAIAHPDA